MKLAGLTLALLLCLVGCGGSSDAPAKPKTWTKTQAGHHYLTMVKASNDTLDRLVKAVNKPKASVKSVAPLCKDEAGSLDTFMRDLSSGHWPANVKSDVDALITQLSGTRSAYHQCAEATDLSVMATALNSANDASKTDRAQVLRVKLGLPGTD